MLCDPGALDRFQASQANLGKLINFSETIFSCICFLCSKTLPFLTTLIYSSLRKFFFISATEKRTRTREEIDIIHMLYTFWADSLLSKFASLKCKLLSYRVQNFKLMFMEFICKKSKSLYNVWNAKTFEKHSAHNSFCRNPKMYLNGKFCQKYLRK